MSELLIDSVMLANGYTRMTGGTTVEHCKFEVIQALDNGTFLVKDPWDDMRQHWAITPDEVEIEQAQGSTTPIPWMRTRA